MKDIVSATLYEAREQARNTSLYRLRPIGNARANNLLEQQQVARRPRATNLHAVEKLVQRQVPRIRSRCALTKQILQLKRTDEEHYFVVHHQID